MSRPGDAIPFASAFRYWAKLGFINFGGPAGQIAVMHDELVERKRWISNERFLHALNYCMLLPGPEAQQLAIYIGWLLNGVRGGLAAGILFIFPAFVLILGLSWVYVVFGDIGWVAAVFYGLRAAVVALVAVAVIRVGRKALTNWLLGAIAAGAFVAIFFLHVPFPVIVAVALLIGWAGARWAPGLFATPELDDGSEEEGVVDRAADRGADRTPSGTLRVALIGLAVWWLPLLAVIAWRGTDDTISHEALFFSQLAVITFGGAYAVLAYINEAAVQVFGWLEPGQMLAGLGLAESTPGPLIMVTEFVGFLAAYRFPGELEPATAGVLGALVTVWATFAPCFLWIFVSAPYVERLRHNQKLKGALAAVTAAVVGVILNLALTLAVAALFRPGGLVDWFALLVAAVGFVALWRYRVHVLWVIGGSAVAGLLYLAVFEKSSGVI